MTRKRKSKKTRTEIPPDVAAKVLFQSNRTCCVCRTPGKLIQIHHIDEDPSNHALENLCVLCNDCHNLTIVRGGFYRLLSAEQIVLYRDDWLSIVQKFRSTVEESTNSHADADKTLIELVTSEAEIYRQNKEYDLLAQHYHSIGNEEFRDKYIRKALAKRPRVSAIDEIHLRALQKRAELVPKGRVRSAIKMLSKAKDFSQLARLQVELGNSPAAVQAYCTDIINNIKKKNIFSAAFYLKELADENLHARLFEVELRARTEAGDLWWQIRCLQELGWYSELADLLKGKRKEIEASGNYTLLSELYLWSGDKKRFLEVQKKIAKGKTLIHTGGEAIVSFPIRDEGDAAGVPKVRPQRKDHHANTKPDLISRRSLRTRR